MHNKITQILAKEIGLLLTSYRKKSHLSQSELANRIGLSPKSGKISISRLEKGKFKKISLDLILDYLTVCEKPWASFFEKLAGIYFNKQHDRIMTQVAPPMHHKKIDRDVAKYTHSIKTKFSKKQDLKPIEQQQKEKMSVRFGKYRAVIEPIEREITILLGNSGEPLAYNQFYKAFARECYGIIKKITAKTREKESTKEISADSALKINQIIEKWIKKGLKREILEKIKEIPIKYFQPQVNTDEHS